MEKMVDGKVCVVTGAGRGIAKAAALRFAKEGGKVVVCDLDADPALETVEEIKKMGSEAVAVICDVTTDGMPEQIIQTAVDSFGGLDVIVNTAGYTWDAMIQNMTDQQWDAILKIHITAPFRILRAASHFIREKAKAEREAGIQNYRKVINIGSTAGTHGNPGQTNYSTAKAGLIGMTKTLAKEWGRYNVNVNCVAFGVIDTRLVQEKKEGEEMYIEREGKKIHIGVPGASREKWKMAIPLGRPGTPDEAARAILFFASSLSDYVSGQTLIVGGGYGGF